MKEGETLEEALAESGPNGIFTRIVTEVDPAVAAIFQGHTHQEYTWSGPIPGDEDNFRPIVSTGSYGKNVGKVVLTVDKETNDVTQFTQELVPVATFAEGKTTEEMKDSSPAME